MSNQRISLIITDTMKTMPTDPPPMTQSWSSIVAWYEELPTASAALAGVAELARYIRDSELSSGLFGWTSAVDLCVVQRPVWHPYDGPYLRVRPVRSDSIEFRYFDTVDPDKQWQRAVPAYQSIERLNGFLAQLHWFSSAAPSRSMR